MFARDRTEMLEVLGRMGAAVCPYSLGGADGWLDTRCDCKYGGEAFGYQPRGTFGGRPLPYCGEQTGCPELRLLYAVVAVMTDDEWRGAYERAGGVDPAAVARAIAAQLSAENRE